MRRVHKPIQLKNDDKPLDFHEWWNVPLDRLTAEVAITDAKHPWRSAGAREVFAARVTRRANLALVLPTWALAVATAALVLGALD